MKVGKIDRLGRVVVPITIRRALNLCDGSSLEIYLEEDKIIMRRPTKCCRICYADIDNGNSFGICTGCINKIKKL